MTVSSANGHNLHEAFGVQTGGSSVVEQTASHRISRLIKRCVEQYGSDALRAINPDTIDMSKQSMSLDGQLAKATGKPSLFSQMRGTQVAQVELGLFPDGAVDWDMLTQTCQAQMRAYLAQYL